MKFNKALTSFASGELDPKVRGRTESPTIATGLRTMLNALPFRSGGGFKRPGTEYLLKMDSATGNDYLTNPTDTNVPSRIIPYVHNDESYLLVLRQAFSVATLATNAEKVIRLFKHDKLAGTFTEVTVIASNTITFFALSISGFNYEQVGDVLVITHISGLIAPMYLVPGEISGFSFSTIAEDVSDTYPYGMGINEVLKVPYFPENTSTRQMTPGATTGNTTLTTIFPFFQPTHVGAYFRLIHGAVEGVAIVTGYNSPTSVNITVKVDFGNNIATAAWKESAWSNYRGWPRTVGFIYERIAFGGTPFTPDTVYITEAGKLNHLMSLRLVQDQGSATDVSGIGYFGDDIIRDAFNFVPTGARANRITWMTSGKNLNVGTSGGEFTVGAGTLGFGFNSVVSETQTAHGGKAVQAAQAANLALFVSKDGRRLRGFRFSEENGSFIAPDLSIASGHIYRHFDTFEDNVDKQGFTQMEWQEETSTLWLRTSHGALTGLTLDTTSNVAAWHRHTIGAYIHSLASTSTEGTEDVYFFTNRTVNGALGYYIERLSTYFDRDTFDKVRAEEDEAFYTDFSTKAVNTGGNVFRAAHLPNATVRVVADGTDLGDKVLDVNGDVDLGSAYTTVLMGFSYTMKLQTYKLEAGSKIGDAQIAPQRIDKILLRIYRCLGGRYGWGEEKTYPVEYKRIIGDNGTDWAKTGDFMTEFSDLSYLEDRSIFISSSDPLPFNVLMIVARGNTED